MLLSGLMAASDRRDGNWWIDQNEYSHVTYVTGFFDGMDLGHNFSYWKWAHDSHKTGKCLDLMGDAYREYHGKFFANITSGQLADGLNVFYRDYRNRRILVSNAIWLVVNSIAGTPQVQLDKMIESWRQNAGDK